MRRNRKEDVALLLNAGVMLVIPLLEEDPGRTGGVAVVLGFFLILSRPDVAYLKDQYPAPFEIVPAEPKTSPSTVSDGLVLVLHHVVSILVSMFMVSGVISSW